MGISPKMSSPWGGPYIIIKKLSDILYRIQRSPGAKPKVVHQDRLWRCRTEVDTSWAKLDRTASQSEMQESPSNDLAENDVRTKGGDDHAAAEGKAEGDARTDDLKRTADRPRRSRRRPKRLEDYEIDCDVIDI